MPVELREFRADREDFDAYLPLRVRALEEHPESFGSAPEDMRNFTYEAWIDLRQNPNMPAFGAFIDGDLVGTIGMNRSPRAKMRHRMDIGAMYVMPEHQGKGIGRMLLDKAIDYARTQDGVEDIVLAVTCGNNAARHLYRSAGFVSWGIDPRYIKHDGIYYDIEWMVLVL